MNGLAPYITLKWNNQGCIQDSQASAAEQNSYNIVYICMMIFAIFSF